MSIEFVNLLDTPPPSNFKLDSFKMRIPLRAHHNYASRHSDLRHYNYGDPIVILNDVDLGVNYITLNELTGEVIKSSPNLYGHVNDKGVKTTYGIEQINANGLVTEYLTIKITSKHLRGSYFEGIKFSNIETVYKSLMSLKKFYVPYQDFLHGELTDADYCRDLIIQDYEGVKQVLQESTKPSTKTNKGIHTFESPTSKGLKWSDRETASSSSPYVKIYNKGLQVRHDADMFTFTNEFLDIDSISTSQYRIEFTLKNKRHFGKYKIGNTLLSHLRLSQDRLLEIARLVFNCHLEGIYKIPRSNRLALNESYPVNNTNEFNLYMLILAYRKLGLPITSLVDEYCHFVTSERFNLFDKQTEDAKRQRVYRYQDRLREITKRLPDNISEGILHDDKLNSDAYAVYLRHTYNTALNLQNLGVIQDLEDALPDGFPLKRLLSEDIKQERLESFKTSLERGNESWDLFTTTVQRIDQK